MSDEQMFGIPGSRLQELRDQLRAAQIQADPHGHEHWEVMGIEYPVHVNIPPHPRQQPEPVFTKVLLRCKDCKWLAVASLAGKWSESQIMEGDYATGDTPSD